MELAQLELLEEFFDVAVGTGPAELRLQHRRAVGDGRRRRVHAGTAPCPSRSAAPTTPPSWPQDTTLGVLFSRGPAIVLKDVQDLCTAVSSEGQGMVGVSSYLSPNTVLVIGQGDTLDRLERVMPAFLPDKTMLRRKPHKLPPLHTPLVWQRNIPNRAAVALYKIAGGLKPPSPQGRLVRHRHGQLRRARTPAIP